LFVAEGIKLPDWVKQSDKKTGKLRNPEKLRRNRPAEEAAVEPEEAPTDEPAADAEVAPAEEAVATEEAPAPEANAVVEAEAETEA
jgi:hypothetical protein